MAQPTMFESCGAAISIDGSYRYRLWRSWGSGDTVAFVMLNPSTADATTDDPTIRKCVGFAKAWGFSRLEVVNLFAWRATDPKILPFVAEPIGMENNDTILDRCLLATWVVCAWGQNKFAQRRARDVVRMLTGAGVTLRCLRRSKDGHPWHPLYLPYETMPLTFHAASTFSDIPIPVKGER